MLQKYFLSTQGFIQRMENGHRFAGCKKDIRHGLGISVDENLVK